MKLSTNAKRFYDEKVPRHGHLSSKLKHRIWDGIQAGEIKQVEVTQLGNRVREHIANARDDVQRTATAVERLRKLEHEVQTMPISEAVAHMIEKLGTKETAVIKRRRELAKTIMHGRNAERQGVYELSRGISSYNRWLGVNLQHEARKLARTHGPITVLDAGGGTGFAMADLKSRLRTKLKKAHVTSLTNQIARRERPYSEDIAPVMHVAHVEKIPLPSSSVHLITSVRGATWYTTRTIHHSVRELTRVLASGGRAFLHLAEPNEETEARLSNLFKRENLKHTYTYGFLAAKRGGDNIQVKNVLRIFNSQAERDRIVGEMQPGLENGKYDYVTKYRVLALEK